MTDFSARLIEKLAKDFPLQFSAASRVTISSGTRQDNKNKPAEGLDSCADAGIPSGQAPEAQESLEEPPQTFGPLLRPRTDPRCQLIR